MAYLTLIINLNIKSIPRKESKANGLHKSMS